MKTNYQILFVLLLIGILRVVSAVCDSPIFAVLPPPTEYRPHRLYAVLGGALICLLVVLVFQKAKQHWNR